MSDEGKVVQRQGIGGPVTKEAIAQSPATHWAVMQRDRGTWTEVASYGTEEEAQEQVEKLHGEGEGLELMVVNKA